MNRTASLRGLAWPILIELLLQFMIGMTDTLMVSQVSDDAVAVVGISNTFFSAVIILFAAVNSGAGVVIAQKWGGGKYRDANKAAVMALSVISALSLLLGVGLYFGDDLAVQVLQVPERLVPLAKTYLSIVGGGVLFTSMHLTLTTILRNTGDTRSPMWIATVMNLIHLAGNYAFIHGAAGFPKWGLYGVAWSTVGSRVIAVSLLLMITVRLLRKKVSNEKTDGRRFDGRLFREMLRIGLPMAIGSASWSFSQVIMYAMIASMGPDALAARTYMGTIENLPVLAGWSIGMAIQIRVAQLYGAGNIAEAYRTPYQGFRVGMLIVMCITVIIAIFIRPIMQFFTPNDTIVELCAALMLMNLLFQPCKMINMSFNTALVAIGETRFIMITNLIFIWGICIGVSYIWGIWWGYGIIGVYAAMTLDEGIRGVLVFRKWKKNRSLAIPINGGSTHDKLKNITL